MRWLSVALLLMLVAPISAQAQTRPCNRATTFLHVNPTGPVEIAPPLANQRVYYCGFVLAQKGQVLDFKVLTGTGVNCGTDQTLILSLELPSDLVLVNRIASVGPSAPPGQALCIETVGAAGARLSGVIYWAQF
jgi:hypothetical protein